MEEILGNHDELAIGSLIIVIKEVGSTVQVIQKVQTTSTSSMEAMDSNHEEKDDDMTSNDDVACNELRRNDKMARTTEEEAVQETPNFEIDLENVEGNESQNGYSKEILKLAQYLPPLEVEKQQMNNDYYPPGFGSQDLVAATITSQPLENVEQQVKNKEGQN
ncbi:hypothetical protein Cgig2_026916 [Carnegiea gigantea]|uniref:Uncharacterized protein n=1 Tax=Carnegiea gigantea TaxID=171969 RepID=A0A9Q1QQT0_9CARY|nr:hypothetical protein Cgig2_026916 [Carnegiea gigantea]